MSDRCLAELRAAAPVVLPSLLLCDFGDLASEVERLEQAGVRALHLDVMDGHFVPNLTYGLPIVEALRRRTDLLLDVHLMIANPEAYVERFRDAGADIITIHAEATDQPGELLERIRSLGGGAGLAINPGTPVAAIERHLDNCDLVLTMSVEAGFGGQQFNAVALEKLSQLRQHVGPDVLLEVDGGINERTIGACAAAGATLFVAGSSIFRSDDYGAAVRKLTELAASQMSA
jgi:ribulose-phosphate 3-epimerase